ncbi:hypothetical protein [Cribrihabitans pelagius]|uniref:hypothetical protein n=1 Tax=Cribrihabitans pelagius TaxID=1765746 RepID=UPI003B5A6363
MGKTMHRFYFEFGWDVKPLLLQSRVHDSTGYVQHTKQALQEQRREFVLPQQRPPDLACLRTV